MNCTDNNTFMRSLAVKAAGKRVPLFGTFEITYRCNLNCVHCYIPDHSAADKLSTEEILRLIDECADSGCLALLLTGGEPFVREDFDRIYLHAKSKGLILYVFSNGMHIPEKFFGIFKRYPPYLLDISLYGASEEAYERTTGRAVFGRVIENIRRLQACSVRVLVKPTLLRTNVDELPAVQRLLQDLRLPLRLNVVMNHAYDGSGRPAQYRLTPDEIVSMESRNPEAARNWRQLFQSTPATSTSDRLYSCGAGANSFCITPSGELKICATVQKWGIDLKLESFASAWARLDRPFRPLRLREDHPCRSCKNRPHCGQCAALALSDVNDEQAVVPHLCEITRKREMQFA